MARIIDSDLAVAEGLDWLAAHDPGMARARAEAGDPPARRRDPGFHGLAAIITSQQLSTSSARAIFARLEARWNPLTAADLLGASDEELRALGLSGPKIRALRAIAEAEAGGLDFAGMGALEAEEAHARLVALHGVGPWSADNYLLFCLGHADAFAEGDLALQEGARMVEGWEERPTAKALKAHAERWRPWRGVASLMLWRYYGHRRALAGRAGDGAPA